MTAQETLTVEQIADILKITPNTIHSKRWRNKWHAPLYKMGKRLFANKPEFDRWYQDRMIYG